MAGRHCYKDVLPFTAMVAIECTNVGVSVLFKAATQKGLSYYVFIAYSYVVSTLVLLLPLPFFIKWSRGLPPLNMSLLFRIFLLGVLGVVAQLFGYKGLEYTTPTLSSSLSNLIPAFTFILAIIFRMEKVKLRWKSSQAKILGSTVSILGALAVVLYKGPIIIPSPSTQSPPIIHSPITSTTESNWILGGSLLVIEFLIVPIWYIIQTTVIKEYPAEIIVVFLYNLCGVLVSIPICLLLEPNLSAWKINPDITMISIIWSEQNERTMEVATANASFTFLSKKPMLISPSSSRTLSPIRPIKSSFRNSISTDFVAPSSAITSSTSHFSGHKLRPPCLNPATFQSSGSKRGVVTMVIPFSRGTAWEQPPPDLASYLFKNRIVYLGMSLVPSVTELMVAEFIYLQYDDDKKPIYMYINSTGTTKGGEKLGYETEALAIYDLMRYIKPPIFTLCIGNAWGEAALLLATGAKGNRSALPSSNIMIRQPIARFQGQATDVNLARKEITRVKTELVNLLAKHTEKTPEQIEADVRRPKYFSPTEAVEYGIIDKVLYNERGSTDRGVVSDLKKAQLI